MNNLNFAAVKQMAATCAALKNLLGEGREIVRFQAMGGNGFSEGQGDLIGAATMQGVSTLAVTFRCEGEQALVDQMLLMAVSKHKQLTISFCSFVRCGDGRYALRLMNRDQPTEYVLSRSSGRLVCRSVKDDSARAAAELEGLRALLAKAAEPACQDRSFQVA